MRNCPKCNIQVLDNEAKFCIECGADSSSKKSSAKCVVNLNLQKKSAVVTLKKGQRADLTKMNPDLKKLIVVISWNINKYDSEAFDLDATAFLLGTNGKIMEETDFIFYLIFSDPAPSTTDQFFSEIALFVVIFICALITFLVLYSDETLTYLIIALVIFCLYRWLFQDDPFSHVIYSIVVNSVAFVLAKGTATKIRYSSSEQKNDR